MPLELANLRARVVPQTLWGDIFNCDVGVEVPNPSDRRVRRNLSVLASKSAILIEFVGEVYPKPLHCQCLHTVVKRGSPKVHALVQLLNELDGSLGDLL
jgi:hypothetical protein